MENLFGRLEELLPPPLCCCEHDDLVANFMLVGAFSGYCEIPQRFVDSSTGHLAPPLSSRNIYICDVDNRNLLICPLPGAECHYAVPGLQPHPAPELWPSSTNPTGPGRN